MPYSIPHLTTVGNHYDTGLLIGTEFKHRINEFIKVCFKINLEKKFF